MENKIFGLPNNITIWRHLLSKDKHIALCYFSLQKIRYAIDLENDTLWNLPIKMNLINFRNKKRH